MLRAGELIDGRYRVIELLGQGGSSSVYKVEQVFLRRQFALKIMQADNDQTEAALRRFHQEAQMTSRLEHPNICRTTDCGAINDAQPFLVMELIQGPTLYHLLKQEGSLPLESAIKILAPICMALSYAHRQGLVHRDLKPSNIIIESAPDGSHVPKLVDFGIAQFMENAGLRLTKTGEIFGTPLYMSPEQCRGQRVDHRADIYAMGCVLYETLTSAPPFFGANLLETTSMHLNAKVMPLSEAAMGKKFPAGIERVVEKALQKDPKERYQSAEQLGEDLFAIARDIDKFDLPGLRELSDVDPSAVTVSVSSGRSRKRKALVVVACTIAPIVALAAFATVNMQRKPASDVGTQTTATATKTPDSILSGISVVHNKPYCRSQPGEKKKRFQFPDQSIGHLVVRDDKSSATLDARGYVSVNPDERLEYCPIVALVTKQPEILDHFNADDLDRLTFRLTDGVSVLDSGNGLDNVMKHASQLQSLKTIDLAFTDVTAAGLRSFNIDNKPKLEEVLLERTSVDPKELAEFKFIPKARSLAVSGIGKITPVLARLKDDMLIGSLCIAEDQVNDEDMKIVSSMKNLGNIDLSGNQLITKQGFHELSKLRNLHYLDLHGTHFSKDLTDIILHLPLESITLPSEYWSLFDARAFYLATKRKCEVHVQDRSGARRTKILR